MVLNINLGNVGLIGLATRAYNLSKAAVGNRLPSYAI